jgi:hypothetical protein
MFGNAAQHRRLARTAVALAATGRGIREDVANDIEQGTVRGYLENHSGPSELNLEFVSRQFTRRVNPAQCGLRNAILSTLPTLLSGSCATKSSDFGACTEPLMPRTKSISSAAVAAHS